MALLPTATPINRFGTIKWIVAPQKGQGHFTNMNDVNVYATAGDTVYIKQGTYNIGNWTAKAGVNYISGDTGQEIQQNTKFVGSVTMTESGRAFFYGITFVADGGPAFLSNSSNSSQINLTNCYVTNATGYNAVQNSTSTASVIMTDCTIEVTDSSTAMFALSAGAVELDRCKGYGNCVVSTVSAGTLTVNYSTFPWAVTSSGTGTLDFSFCICNVANNLGFTIGGSGGATFIKSNITTGTATAITHNAATAIPDCIIGSSNSAITTGSSSLLFGNALYANLTDPRSETHTEFTSTPSGYPYTANVYDSVIWVATDSAHTVNIPNAPPKGKVYTLKDVTGTGATNNITVTTPGGTVTIDGATSYTMTNNYQSLSVCFDGTNYFVI